MNKAVIDQPGIRVFSIGLVLSFIIGLTFRHQISSNRVESLIQKSIAKSEKEFRIDFETAEIKLSKWGFPWPYLLIEKVRISSKKQDCKNSQIYVDLIESPISFNQILNLKYTIQFVRAQNVEVRLTDVDRCFNLENKSKTIDKVIDKNEGPLVSAVSLDKSDKSSSSFLKELVIEQLKIVSVKNIEQPFIFKQLKLIFSYDLSKISQVDIKSRLFSLKDERSNIYFLNADLMAQVRPNPDQNIEATLQLKGQLLDGEIQIFSKLSSFAKKISYEMSLKKVSVKALSPLMGQLKKQWPIDKWPLSMSFYMLGETLKTSEVKSFFRLKDFSLVGENTLINSPALDIELVNDKASFKPFQMNFKQFNLNPLKNSGLQNFDFQSFENLGFLSGEFKFEDLNHWSLSGPLQKTELIFSNRGTREIQVVDSIQLNLEKKAQNYNLKLDDFVLNSQEAIGELEAQFNDDQNSLQIKMNLEGVLLSEKIWKQLTFIKQSPVLKVNWLFKKVTEERNQLKLAINEMKFSGLHINDLQADLLQLKDSQNKSMGLNLKANKIRIHVPDLTSRYAQVFFNSENQLTSLDYDAFKTQLNFEGFDWKNLNFDLDSKIHDAENSIALEIVKAKGEWKADRPLTGQLLLQNIKRSKKFNILKSAKDEIDFLPIVEKEEIRQ